MEHTTQNLRLEKEIEKLKINKRNKIFLGLFLGFCLITLACKIIDGILLDIGLRDGKAHLGFWTDPNWLAGLDKNSAEYLSGKAAAEHHPNTIWFITQFTWITTIMIIIFLTVRLFKYEGQTPRWLKWVMTQRSLSWVASFDLVVAIIFWASMFNGFSKNFNGDLKYFELTYTIFVHAVIPFLILVYAFVYLIFDKKASLLRIKFIYRGLAYISFYLTFYLILTIIWDDPYPVTNMHKSLVEEGWKAWASELWKIPLAVFAVYFILGAMFVTHNFVLLKFNKHYLVERDYEAWLERDEKIKNYQLQVMKDIMKSLRKRNSEQNKN